MMSLIISLLSGAAGGNIVAKLIGSLNQGVAANSIAGIVGGGVGSQILGALVPSMMGGSGVEAIISQVAGGGVGGGVALWLFGLIKGMMNK